MSERSPDDHLRDDGVRGIGQAKAHAEIHVQPEHLEVDDPEESVLVAADNLIQTVNALLVG
jgi:hypothetical protein